jgi:lipoprotein-anchoring transpeptidase ErfK/SrfK
VSRASGTALTAISIALLLSGATAVGLSSATAIGYAASRAALPPAPTAAQAWIAKVVYPTVARSLPGAGRRLLAVSPTSTWDTPTELLVLGARLDSQGAPWVRVRLDYRPNGFAAWIDAQDTVLHQDPWRISVSRRRRTVRVYRAARLVRRFAAVVGKPSTPTPAGLFAIAAELPQPDPGEFEGSWVLPLTAHSNVLAHFDGGDGQVALHGRGGASLLDPLGTARSHGCVRVANVAIAWIATHVPVGTPVRIQ